MVKSDLTTEQVLNAIRKHKPNKSECNIKTLDTIDTKNQKTKNYETSSVFAPGVFDAKDDAKHSQVIPQLPLAVASLQEERSSQDNSVTKKPPDITYLSASLKAPRTATRTLNVDFRLGTSASGNFNKILFSLTDRYRDFFPNIDESRRNDWCYQQAWEYYHSLTVKEKWIAKGRRRGKFIKGNHVNQKIKFGLSAVLELRRGVYVANVWIEGNHFEFELSPVDNVVYPFRYDSKTTLDVTEYEDEGGWL